MAKLQISMDEKLKNEAESIIDELGMSPKTAVTVFISKLLSKEKSHFLLNCRKK